MGEYVQAIRKLRVTTPLGEDVILLSFDAILGRKERIRLQLPTRARRP